MFRRNIISFVRRAVQKYINPPIGYVQSVLKVKIYDTNTSHRTNKNEE